MCANANKKSLEGDFISIAKCKVDQLNKNKRFQFKTSVYSTSPSTLVKTRIFYPNFVHCTRFNFPPQNPSISQLFTTALWCLTAHIQEKQVDNILIVSVHFCSFIALKAALSEVLHVVPELLSVAVHVLNFTTWNSAISLHSSSAYPVCLKDATAARCSQRFLLYCQEKNTVRLGLYVLVKLILENMTMEWLGLAYSEKKKNLRKRITAS